MQFDFLAVFVVHEPLRYTGTPVTVLQQDEANLFYTLLTIFGVFKNMTNLYNFSYTGLYYKFLIKHTKREEKTKIFNFLNGEKP